MRILAISDGLGDDQFSRWVSRRKVRREEVVTRASEVRLGGGVLGWLRRSLGLESDRRVVLRGGTEEERREGVVEGREGGMD